LLTLAPDENVIFMDYTWGCCASELVWTWMQTELPCSFHKLNHDCSICVHSSTDWAILHHVWVT